MGDDKILLTAIGFYGYHGDLPEERELGQRFRVDLELFLDTRPAARQDRLEATVDYARVVQRVREIGRTERYRLVESLAERIAAALLDEFTVEAVRVRLIKPHPPIPATVEGVGVEIFRRRP